MLAPRGRAVSPKTLQAPQGGGRQTWLTTVAQIRRITLATTKACPHMADDNLFKVGQ